MRETCLKWKLTNKFRFQFTSCLRESIPEEERKLVIYDLICKKNFCRKLEMNILVQFDQDGWKTSHIAPKDQNVKLGDANQASSNWCLMQSKLLASGYLYKLYSAFLVMMMTTIMVESTWWHFLFFFSFFARNIPLAEPQHYSSWVDLVGQQGPSYFFCTNGFG